MYTAEDRRWGGDPLIVKPEALDGEGPHDGLGSRCIGERLVSLARVAAAQHMLLAAHEGYDAALPSNRPPRDSFRSSLDGGLR